MAARSLSKTALVAAFTFLSASYSIAASDSAPILEITHGETVTELSIEDLRDIGETEFATSTIWTEGVHSFTGVLLKDLLDHLDAEADDIQATAINDYMISIPTSDATADGPILAFEMDGQTMSRRTKGPIWVVYPYDKSAKFRTEAIYARSIWQLNRLNID